MCAMFDCMDNITRTHTHKDNERAQKANIIKSKTDSDENCCRC